MKRAAFLLLLAATASLFAQSSSSAPDPAVSFAPAQDSGGNSTTMKTSKPIAAPPAPFSRLALGGGISAMGINMQAAVIANRYINIRGTGNYFTYTVNNVTIDGNNGSNGVNVSGQLNFATAGVAVDFYPFPNHGFRLSPGAMLYNQNQITASGVSTSGASITLGSQKYYADSVNPMSASANLGLNTHKQAFTMTTGWGNMISRRGGHFSVPFELGAVFTGVPTLGINLAGNACLTSADAADNGPSCVNMATNTTAQSNLAAQITKYQNDLNPLKVYPILSIGVAYNFKIR